MRSGVTVPTFRRWGEQFPSSININRPLLWLNLITVSFMISVGITPYLSGGTMDREYWAILIVLLNGILGVLSI